MHTAFFRSLGLFSLVLCVVAGCTSDSYLNPSQISQWERTHVTMIGHPADSAGRSQGKLSVASQTTQAAPPPAAEPQPILATRQVVYTGSLTVLSPDPNGALAAVRKLAEDAGGYVSSVRRQRIVVRVPADRFDAVMEAVADLGLVTDRQIDASDITEQLLDLDIRLDNLEALRLRMKALLEKADKIEDALKIEKELARLTTTIESIKGKLRLLHDRVALSTLTVTLNSPTAAASGLATRVRPFPWVNTVGSEAFGAARLPTAQSKLGKGAKLELPPGFVRFYQQSHSVYAINRGQVVIKITRQSNFDAADAGFWADQVRDRLAQDLGVPVEKPTKITLRDNEVGYAMTGNRPAGKDPLGYFVGLAANKKHVFLIEAWGPADQLAGQHEALTASLKTLRVNRGWW